MLEHLEMLDWPTGMEKLNGAQECIPLLASWIELHQC